MLMREEPARNYDLAVRALIKLLERLIKLDVVIVRVSTAVINDKGTILESDYMAKTEVACSITE